MFDVPSAPPAICREEWRYIEVAPTDFHLHHPEDVSGDHDMAPLPSRLLLETGDFLLLESGDKLLLEFPTFDARISSS